ncbi:hypothetical protein C6B38_03545 [Spiroplasma sp. ChiS]|uniref:hypothetical protein n=1 Tax=Spiroplasma sp. ChiS TaxID=2099885 RepID=UPI000CF98C26|nr:hypothetical protein [Spiroplasma sp. ChiS]PQP78852.1 hypothetical protein C6B38_03545 [Spiroplasma sp. ChiS]
MKKILGLLSSFTLLTTGITPLMAMMPNNSNNIPESSNRRNQGINDQINEGKDKLFKDTLFHDPEGNFILEPWVIYLKNKSLKDIKKIFNETPNPAIKIIQVIDHIVTILNETGNNEDEVKEFITKIDIKNELYVTRFYNNFLNSIKNIFDNPIIMNTSESLIIILNINGEIKKVFFQ